MADINTVPLGQAGTGAAFLLGPSKALDNWISQDQRNRQVRQANAAAQAQFNQNIAKSYSTNAIKAPLGQAYRAEVLGDVEKLNKVGAQYLAQGFDVYNPNYNDKNQVAAHNQYLADRNILEQKIAAQKAYDTHVKDQREAYSKDPFGYENQPDNIFTDFEKNNTLQNVVTNGMSYPTLQKTFDYDKNVRNQIPVMDRDETKVVGNDRITTKVADVPRITSFAKNLLSSGPNRNYLEKEIGGSLDGLLFETDEALVKKALDSEFRSPTGMQMMAELRNQDKVPAFGTPQYDKFLNDAVKEQLKAENKYDKVLSNAVQDGIAKVNPDYKKIPDFSLAREQRQQRAAALAEENARMKRTRFSERKTGGQNDEAVLYRQKTVDDMLNGVEGSGERFKAIVSAMPGYDKDKVENMIGSQGNFLEIRIPEKVVEKSDASGTPKQTITPAYTVTIDKRSPEGKLKLNRLLSDITGENVSESKFQTGNATGKVKGAIQTERDRQAAKPTKTVPVSKIESLVGKKGYEGYSKKELIDYYKGLGYTIK